MEILFGFYGVDYCAQHILVVQAPWVASFPIVVYWYFFLTKAPQTSGLALEEIDGLFGKEPAGHIDDAGTDLESPKYPYAHVEDAVSQAAQGSEKLAWNTTIWKEKNIGHIMGKSLRDYARIG
jgi:hypothetical protein